jgi:hypothetical protein
LYAKGCIAHQLKAGIFMIKSARESRRKSLLMATSLSALLAGIGASPAQAAATFDQVLAQPDDPQTNLDFAREEANDGYLLNAAAALERILLSHPNAHGVRLFYAAVLYRLHDLQGAKQQLKELESVHLTPLQTAELDKYEALVENGESATSFTGKISAGVAVESDAIGALLNQLDFPGLHSAKNGAAALTAGDIELTHDLSADSDYSLYAGASIYSRSSFEGPNADFQFGEFRTGVAHDTGSIAWQFGPVFRHYLIFDNPYLTEYGGQQETEFRWSPSLTFSTSLELVGQSYHEPFIDSLVPFIIPGTHDGMRYTIGAGATYRIDAYSTIGGTVGYEGKNAGNPAWSYDSAFLGANYHVLLGKGAYADVQGDIRYLSYRARDFAFLSGTKREDVRSDARVALGAPFSAFTADGATGDFRENLIVEGAISFEDRTTRFPLAPFHSLGGELRLIWKFGGGL